MTNRIASIALTVFYAIVILFVGCIPQDSLQWSSDGSVGLLRTKDALYLVDGDTGKLTPIPDSNVWPWPGISNNGKIIAYTLQLECNDLSQTLNLLPPGQIKLLKNHARLMRDKIFRTGLVNGQFPSLGKPTSRDFTDSGGKDSFNENYRNWVIRYLCENADGALAEKIGSDIIKKTKETKLTYFQLFTSPASDPNARQLIATSIQPLCLIRFSPDARLIGYLMQPFETHDMFEGGFDFYVASTKQNVNAMLVDSTIAAGYDWRPDGRAVAYLKTDNYDGKQLSVGTLVEKTVVDADNELLATPADPNKETSFATHTCTGETKELAGTIFYPWIKAQYGRDGRIFFATAELSLPSSKLEEEKWSLFCYDSLTAAVTDAVPRAAADFAGGNIHLFALSPDGTKLLLPGKKTTLGLYPLGSAPDLKQLLVPESEGFGDDLASFAPAWKGNNEVSFLVSEKSHYLTADADTPHHRKEIVILDSQGNLKQILSSDWPDLDLLK